MTQSENQTPAPEVPKIEKRSAWGTISIVIITLLVTLILCLIVVLALIVTGTGKSLLDSVSEDNEETTENTEDESEPSGTGDAQSTTSDTAKFTGDYITAEMPTGWIITEYTNGDGTDMLVEGVTYTGLTGMKISKPGGTVVFKMEAVSGIGGVDACGEYFKFSDSSPSYQSDVETQSADLGVPTTIVDLTGGTYSEFYFLGKRVRRINNNLYWDKTAGTGTFDAACGMEHMFWILPLSFTADGMASSTYQISIESGVSPADLNSLDDVLESLAAI